MTNKNQKFTNARLNAIQALYALAFREDAAQATTVYHFLHKQIGNRVIEEDEFGERFVPLATDADAGLFTQLVQTATDKKEQLDEVIQKSLSDEWDKDRLELLLQCILRVGLAEFYVQPNLDAPIIINEYVDITRSFYDGAEINLVNAILDNFSHIIRA